MNRAIDQSFACFTLSRVLSIVLVLVPRADAQTGTPGVAPPKVSREQVERLVYRPATTSFTEFAAIAPLRRRATLSLRVVAVLLGITVTAMAVARYL